MSGNSKILLIDDDEQLTSMLKDNITLISDYMIDFVSSAKEAIDWLNKNDADVIILDVGLPDMDGRDCCRLLRKNGIKTPIIMLTAADSDADQILGLEAGANDYMAKPFRISVLLARVKAQLRQFENSQDATLNIGPWTLKLSKRVMVNRDTNEEERLTDKEVSILKSLYHAKGKVISREDMLKTVWGYNNNVTTHTLETHIYRLRQKIKTTSDNEALIVTDSGGYRLIM